MAHVNTGDVVQIHYTGRINDGTVFDSSEGRDPLEFTAGSEELIQGLSQAVLGMEQGEKKTVTVPPEEGYGPRRQGLEYRVARSSLPSEVQLGDQLSATAGSQNVLVWVTELTEQSAVVDGNHPLAGHTLTFDIEVVSVQSKQGKV